VVSRLGPVAAIGSSTKVGTKTTFKPDSQIFQVTKFTYDALHKRLQELAFLNRGVRIKFFDERSNEGEEFCYERGIVEFVEHLNRSSEIIHPGCHLLCRARPGRCRIRIGHAVHQ
jgi:DNA gyrase subunit B